jgi:hypothetical protein
MSASAVASIRSLLCVAALTLAVGGAAAARADEDDPPTRAARLSYIQGSVSFQPAGAQEWVAPPVNRPLTTGDQLWADRDSRAELQLDGSALRVGATTSLAFLDLSDHVTQVQLSAGTLIVHVRHLYDEETYEIDTPNLAFTVLRSGTYRIAVDSDGGTTTINVRRGQGEVTGGGTAYSLYEGEDYVFAGTDQLVETAQTPSPAPDPLGAWSDGRDNRWEHSASAQYVSPDVVGYQDLDDQGTWGAVPQYGHVWFPRGLEPGWAPYRTGHWAYVPPWGYTWVDDRPWGFAPFHYGRWIWTGGAWGWVPAPPPVEGAVYIRPVYAPALVAWVGAGATIAWFALGPREVFVPSYPVSRNYVDAVNVSNTTVNTTIVNNVYNTTIVNKTVVNNISYVNRSAPGAIVATTTQAFTSAAPVASNRVAVNARELAAAPIRALAPTVVPTRQALFGAGRAVTAKPPASVTARPVVARTPPPPPPPSFEQHLKALQNNGGRPLSVAQVRQLQPLAAASAAVHVKVAPPAKTLITPKVAQAAAHAPADRPTTPPPVAAHPAAPATHVAETPPPAAVQRATPAAVHPATPGAVHPATPATHVAETPPPALVPPPSQANSVLERQHLQEQQRLQAQQVAERQRVQQQQEADHQQLAKEQADKAHRQQIEAQLEQQHQQQTLQLQQKQALEQQQMEARQQEQHRQQQVQATSAKKSVPPPKRPPQETPQH